MTRVRLQGITALLLSTLTTACAADSATGGTEYESTPAGAEQFMADAEDHLTALSQRDSQAGWVNANFITTDTDALTADAEAAVAVAVQGFATDSRRFEDVEMPAELARKFELLRLNLTAPPPPDPVLARELVGLKVGMKSTYGAGKYCLEATGECLGITALGKMMGEVRDPALLEEMWAGWRGVGPQMRPDYERFAALSNEGARGLGFADTGEMWRSQWDMPPEAWSEELDRLWTQVRPLYLALHTYVRSRLSDHYGVGVVPPEGMIPAHVLGNMWAQDWTGIHDLLAPAGAGESVNVTDLLVANDVDARGMVLIGEDFFTSLAFEPLPETFWERSLFEKPRDREVVCHASAWTIDAADDIRIKMCIEIDGEDFITVHHELGHNFYQRAYKDRSYLFQDGANGGFHEAIGDAVALSITPAYLVQIGLLDREPAAGAEGDVDLLLQTALDKIAFLPFGLILDKWRWGVFSGDITPAEYNSSWWDLRHEYQGVVAPVDRSEADFDPGAKYHIPANVSYTRYFVATVLQFQFHRALCEAAGFTGPLHRCSVYGSEAAGQKLIAMLELGKSLPWQDALYEVTGEREMDATAIIDYFAPIIAWLEEQNEGATPGW